MTARMKHLDDIMKLVGLNVSVLFGTSIVDAYTLIEWALKILVLVATLVYTIKKIRKIK